MDIIKLRCFVVLSEYLSFSAAAYKLNISQSSLSKHIMSLENELGVALFERRGRNTLLTEAGKSLSENAGSILIEYDLLLQKANGFKKHAVKRTTIGIAPMGCQYFWLRRLGKIMSAHPKHAIEVLERDEEELVALAIRDELEYMIIRKETLPKKGFRTYLLFVDNAVVILPESHPLAHREELTTEDLKNEDLIFMGEATTPHKIFKNACREAGFEPRIACTVKNEANCLTHLQAGDGICPYFESDADFFINMKGFSVVPLMGGIKSEIVLAVPSAKKPGATEKFLAEGLSSEEASVQPAE